MLDIKFIRENTTAIKKAIKDKNIDLDLSKLLKLDKDKREAETQVGTLRARKNELAQSTKGAKPTDVQIKEGKKIKNEIALHESKLREIEKDYFGLMVKIPTIPSPDTPVGRGDSDNVEVSKWGKKPKFDFVPKTHIELAEDLDLIDFERGVKVSGYRGYYLKNEGASLVMALMMYTFKKMIKKGYQPFITPTLVKGFSLFGSGYFKGSDYDPKVDEIYQIATDDKDAQGHESKEKKFLIGTAEPALLAYFSDKVLKEEDLPIRVCGFSPCYRSEIGSYGKDTKGLYRVHEFMKVEQVVISKADIAESDKLQQEMISITEELHQDLDIPYRKLAICTGDMAPGKYKAFDYEMWMPGTNRWGETGSASNFLDWQARRLNIKYIDKKGDKKTPYLLNNTAMPSVRPLIAILENYQQKDGSVIIPKVLHPYMNDTKIIKSKK